jgi:hypothetical protein
MAQKARGRARTMSTAVVKTTAAAALLGVTLGDLVPHFKSLPGSSRGPI